MKKYKCFNCGTVFYEIDLNRTKCSENFVGTYQEYWCPKCIKKRKHILSILEEVEDNRNDK